MSDELTELKRRVAELEGGRDRKERGGCSVPGAVLGGLFLLLLVSLMTCVAGGGPTRTEPRFANGKTQIENELDARIAVRRRLKDPQSAQWGAMFVRDTGRATVVCGSVNAKNGFGGYTGEKSFMVIGDAVLFARDLPQGAFVTAWERDCR